MLGARSREDQFLGVSWDHFGRTPLNRLKTSARGDTAAPRFPGLGNDEWEVRSREISAPSCEWPENFG
jgi:hypothetical protein